MKGIRHICLDKDGVIIDVHLYWTHVVYKRALRLVSQYDISDRYVGELAFSMGADIKQNRIIPCGPVGYKPRTVIVEAAVKALEKIGVNVDNEEIGHHFVAVDQEMQRNDDYNVKLLPCVEDGLKRAKEKGLYITIYSSDRSEHIQRMLKNFNINVYIDACIGGNEVKNPKPEPEGFELACKQVSVPLANSIYVGDTLDDMLMAKKCDSLGGYGVTTGLCSKEQLSVQTQFIFDSLDELINSLDGGCHGTV